jgi:hypothetical protein
MKLKKWLLFSIALLLIGGTAGYLNHLRQHQALGLPGVKTHPVAGSIRLQVELPQHVLGYESLQVPVDEITSNTLPQDTSFGEMLYTAPDRFQMAINVVLMGTDRTSLHKPQLCLSGQGWMIDPAASEETTVPIERPFSYDLPVVKLVATGEKMVEGRHQTLRGVYVYWFVADDAMSASVSGFERMWLMASNLLRTGVLQRWAYVSCFSVCLPGQEAATFERMKKLIATAVPEFQLTPKAEPGALAAVAQP